MEGSGQQQQPPARIVALLRQLEAGFAAPCTVLCAAQQLEATSEEVYGYAVALCSSQEAAAFLR